MATAKNSGTNATASNNTVTSATAATLTLGGSGTYSYGAGTNANSGVITGAISIVKSGSGTQTFGDANTYTGTTMISGGTLLVNVAGSFLIGLFSALSLSGHAIALLGTGFCGGLTTYSAFATQTFRPLMT